ncbi:MAG: ACT domain-containing protein [Firmicutes bacterium]|nr:ACT domain-containing protein [Bacillota bacterium]
MREVITRAKIEKLGDQKELVFPAGTILTEAARQWIKEKGVKITFKHEAPQEGEAAASGREREKEVNRAIVTVLGHDKVGIIAGIAGVLASVNVNILDISQTVLQEFFAMIMIVDLTGCNVDFSTLRKMLEDKGEELELKVTLQHEDIFRFMHRV